MRILLFCHSFNSLMRLALVSDSSETRAHAGASRRRLPSVLFKRRWYEAFGRDEIEKMRRNFRGCDPSDHVARRNFIRKVVKSRTPLHLAVHRSLAGRTAQP